MADLPVHNPQAVLGDEGEQSANDEAELLRALQFYKSEAEQARSGGENPRDVIWDANWDRYWGRYDHSDKMAWQSKHVMPEVPQFVDRWAAAMREALDAGGDWFTAVDETGESNDLTPHINRLMTIILGRCGVTPDGHRVEFSSVFEDQMKQGAITACCAAVTWKNDEQGGWPAVDTVDPREVWRDPKGRNLYRVRRYEVDHHELLALAELEDEDGQPIYNRAKIAELAASHDADLRRNRESSSGSGQGSEAPGRSSIVIDEWVATVLAPDGSVMAAKALIVVANENFLIRGPEPNPFWHKQDWIVLTPMISVPGSIYGRSYMEDWSDMADAFVEMTNLILDSTYISALRGFAAQPDALKDPRQLTEGFTPNVIYLLEEGISPRDFMKEVDTGTLPAEAVRVWTALKQELREGAKLSEIALGQLPPNAHHTATAVSEVSQSASAMIRSMARTIEVRLLEPVLTMLWQNALQHMDFQDLAPEIGQETADMLTIRREEFAERRIRFRVRGISGLIDRQAKLRNMMSMLQTVGQIEPLLQALFSQTTPETMLRMMFRLFGIDPQELKPSERERMEQQVREQQQMAQAQQAQGGPGPQGAGQ